MQTKLPFFTLLLLISFASVNAVLFTPTLPDISDFFAITEDIAQQTMTWYLVGYTFGQLLYGPIANRYGRKPSLYLGISLQIIASLVCVLAGVLHQFWLLVLARFILALGAGVGLKMTFTLVNECYEPKIASQKIAYLMLAFAITPGLSIALGGFLNHYWGWMSCFYASACYGLLLLALVSQIPETQQTINLNALKIRHLLQGYGLQFKNARLIIGGMLMGCTTSIIYIFAALAPFIVENLLGMTSEQYGMANCLPPIGLLFGSLVSAYLSQRFSFLSIIQIGIGIICIGTILMLALIAANFTVLFSLFLPMILINFGLCFIMANASTYAMQGVKDKAHGAAVMSFINMGMATVFVFTLALFPIKTLVLPLVFLALSLAMIGLKKVLRLCQ